ncbi:putative chromatin regulator PHD family [Arabidopsis thaliana]
MQGEEENTNITKIQISFVATMSSVGVFRKEEIDGNPYFVILTETKFKRKMLENYDYGDDNEDDDNDADEDAKEDGDGHDKLYPFNSSSHFPNTRRGDRQGKSLLDCYLPGICKNPVVPLFRYNDKEPYCHISQCGACKGKMLDTSKDYACLQCQRKFHRECVESPLEIKHPSHPFHSLRLYGLPTFQKCFCCETSLYDMFYHCATCDLSMSPVCALKPVPIVIEQSRSHHHPLTFFPAQALICHICAVIKKFDPAYICVQCVFVVHKNCIGFPHVIRISRHSHRISFTSSLPSRKLSCGVCRKQVDNKYGAYSCLECDAYFVHSSCATHPKVWDGKELEGVPEEDDIIDDGEPFERIADGIILHPFHSHHLRLEISIAYDANKYCRGCALPIYEGQFYSCMECDFILHESCANAPRMKRHPLYPHPLTLKVAKHNIDGGIFHCSECRRVGNGFFYECGKENNIVQLDLRCASIIEPFDYQGHEHPLFLPWETEKETRCQMCKYDSGHSKLICMDCHYSICFRCATFPYMARYKHDSHFLTISNGKEESDQQDWCEICERKIVKVKERGNVLWNQKEALRYRCNVCCTTLHIDCLHGKEMYIKPRETERDHLTFHTFRDMERIFIRVHLNSSLSRPVCSRCNRRCPFPIFFKGLRLIYCSLDCVRNLPRFSLLV